MFDIPGNAWFYTTVQSYKKFLFLYAFHFANYSSDFLP